MIQFVIRCGVRVIVNNLHDIRAVDKDKVKMLPSGLIEVVGKHNTPTKEGL